MTGAPYATGSATIGPTSETAAGQAVWSWQKKWTCACVCTTPKALPAAAITTTTTTTTITGPPVPRNALKQPSAPSSLSQSHKTTPRLGNVMDYTEVHFKKPVPP